MLAVVIQLYDVNILDEHVLRGNAAVFKCHIPSFVADFVYVSSWIQDEQLEIYPDNTNYGIYKRENNKKINFS